MTFAALAYPPVDLFGLVGMTLAGKYDVEEVVAETDLSVVYRSTHRIWKRPAAIKAFKAPPVAEGDRQRLLSDFLREGALLMELSERSAAICQARDVGSLITRTGEWVPFTVLEWLDGKSLETTLADERAAGASRRTFLEAIQMLDPIAQALEVAHERGIVHGDIKPGNIFVMAERCPDGVRSKLLDFGVAQIVGSARAGAAFDRSVSMPFTPAYGAPEQFLSSLGPTGPFTDVFALALVVVELVGGHPPLSGETIGALAQSACDLQRRPTPRTHGISVGSEVERVLSRALAVRPAERYGNAGDFWFALKRAALQRVDARAHAAPTPALDSSKNAFPIPLTARRRRRGWAKPALALLGAAACAAALSRVVPGLDVGWASLRQDAALTRIAAPAPAAALMAPSSRQAPSP